MTLPTFLHVRSLIGTLFVDGRLELKNGQSVSIAIGGILQYAKGTKRYTKKTVDIPNPTNPDTEGGVYNKTRSKNTET